MKKKIVFITIYLLVCLAPLCTFWLSEDTSASEKRELSAFPEALNAEGQINTAFFTEFDAWFSDHMGGRSYLVQAQTLMKEKLFMESAESSVILGQNGWLFYEKTGDDYCNVHLLSERNAENVAHSLSMVQKYCDEQGAEFIFTVAPNKNTLYPDNMPARYIKVQGKSNLDVLTEALERNGVHYADLKAAFLQEPRVLYQARDSHWTYEGGMLAYRTIIGSLTKSSHTVFDGVSFTERADWDADLVNMVYPNAADNDVQSYANLDYTFSMKTSVVNDEALVIETFDGAGEGNLLMFRDSFGNTTWRYFAEAFEKAEFQRGVPYAINSIARLKADTVILEIVERNLINLAERAPLMPAPIAEIDIVDAFDMSDGKNTMERRESNGFCHIYGTIDEAYLGTDYRVFAVVDDGEDRTFYEAFPIYEKELLGTAKTNDNGYSCYLPSDIPESATIGILVKTAGMYFYDDMR